MDWWVAQQWNQSPVNLVSWVVWVIVSIVLHELAHGWAAIRAGDDTPRQSGHMTWNPLVHMGQTSLIVFAIFGIAWGQMPVNPSRFRGRYDEAVVALAGPMMNLGLFVVSLAGLVGVRLLRDRLGEPMGGNLAIFFSLGAYLNMALMLFNLLPVPPLDGSRVLATISPAYARLWTGGNSQVVGLIALVAVFIVGARYIFNLAADITFWTLDFVLRLIESGGPPGV